MTVTAIESAPVVALATGTVAATSHAADVPLDGAAITRACVAARAGDAPDGPVLLALADRPLGDVHGLDLTVGPEAGPAIVVLPAGVVEADLATAFRAAARLRDAGLGVGVRVENRDVRAHATIELLAPDVVVSAEGGDHVAAAARRCDAPQLICDVETRAALASALQARPAFISGGQASLGAPAAMAGSFPVATLLRPPAPVDDRTPYDLVGGRDMETIATKGTLLQVTVALEKRGLSLKADDPPVVLSTFQTTARLTPAVRRRYARLGRRAAYVAAFAAGTNDEPIAGVEVIPLAHGAPLCREWVVVLLAAGDAFAVVAEDMLDTGADFRRRFRYAAIDDRETVVRLARGLLHHARR